ncbi:MAG: hypothetical protein O3A59_13355, partial [Nitrospirae bacterium]|nr:hypothetical protein [Nitrospirota bacterium]
EWLSIFVFLKDAEAVVFHDVLAEVWQDPDAQTWHVHGEIVGDTISATSQELRADGGGGQVLISYLKMGGKT